MPENPTRTHGLERFGPAMDAGREAAGLHARVIEGRGHVNLRLDPGSAGLTDAAQEALGQALPLEPNTVTRGAHVLCWLGPDEWHIMTDAERVGALVGALEAALEGHHSAVNDQSGGWVSLRLAGTGARGVLASGCSLDLHPRAFAVGACAQTTIAGMDVLLQLEDAKPTFSLTVRRSFGVHFAGWLQESMDSLPGRGASEG